jgi:hypothetical protein
MPFISLAQKIDKVKVFLDCSWRCDADFFQRKMPYIDFYKDPKTANLHVIVNGERSSNGGEVVTFRFIGVNEFENVDNTLTVDILPNTSDDSERKQYLKVLNKGVYAYIIRTKANDVVSLSYSETEAEAEEKEIEKDKWNNWAFRTSIGGSFNGEEGYKNSRYNGSFTANRITAESKLTSSFFVYSTISKFEYDNFSLETEKKSKRVNMTYVKSKGEHLSIGARVNYSQSTSQNYNGHYQLSPCVEYNLFPYSESSEHRLSLLYGISANHNDYTDTTVYLKTSENFASHIFEFTYDNYQTWGSFSFSISGNQILDKDDMQKYNIWISNNIEWNIAKGLSLDYWGYINFDRSQIHLPLDGATYEEIILRQKELESNYFYYMNFGISYTFGSMKNNVVNPRF